MKFEFVRRQVDVFQFATEDHRFHYLFDKEYHSTYVSLADLENLFKVLLRLYFPDDATFAKAFEIMPLDKFWPDFFSLDVDCLEDCEDL